MNLSRRGLLGMFAAGAGAAIITTPGLLMRVRSPKMITLLDYARRMYPDNHMQEISRLLSEANNQLKELPWIEASTPQPGDTIRINQSIWRVSWSSEKQFGLYP